MHKMIKVVAAVIYDLETDSYFVGQRGKNKKHPLKWEFIGGKIEEGEDLNTALKREFMEEIGIDINPTKFLEKVVFDYVGEIGKIEINFIECDKFEGVPNPDTQVYETCRWVPKLELPSLDWIEADKDFAIRLANKK